MFSTNESKIVRMTEEDRQAINRVIRDKRSQFESVIKRGVIAMLNAQAERLKLQAEHQSLLSALTASNKHKKKNVSDAAKFIKEATSTAPAGIGAASNALLSTATAISHSLYDNAEEKRQDEEAEKRLVSAQFLYYIPSDDYENIAHQVASILSYRYQFLIFRLAGGEYGYIKLARFFIESMQVYAIERLREHKGEHVKSLVHAAIPPSTNARRYREWPSFEPNGFRVKFGFAQRKTLAMDDMANQIVSRCGPAVRAFLGGYATWIDPDTGNEKAFSPYTIRGALHHAFILNHYGEVLSGLETGYRHQGVLRGDAKYPMLLLGCNEITADMGVDVATTQTSLVIQDAHVIALRRLVPNFFANMAPYDFINLNAHKLGLLSHEENKYAEERFEIPWTAHREKLWKERLKKIYTGANKVLEEAEISTISNYNKLIAMRDIGNQFDADQAKADLAVARQAAELRYLAAMETQENRLSASVFAKYLALSLKKFFFASMQSDRIQPADILFSADCIPLTRAALAASLDLPTEEVKRFSVLKRCSERMAIEASRVEELRGLSFNHLTHLIEFLHKFDAYNSFAPGISVILSNRTKRIKRQFTDLVQELEQSMRLSQLILNTDMTGFSLQSSASFEDRLATFYTQTTAVYQLITHAQDREEKISLIKMLHLESKLLSIEIISMLNDENHCIEDDLSWLGPSYPQNLSPDQKHKTVIEKIQQERREIDLKVSQITALPAQPRGWPHRHNAQFDQTLTNISQEIKQHRDTCALICQKIKPIVTGDSAQKIPVFDAESSTLLQRLQAYRQLGVLSLLASHNKDPQTDNALKTTQKQVHHLYLANLQAAFNACEAVVKELNLDQPTEPGGNSLSRHQPNAETIILVKRRLEQAIDGDIDNLASIFKYDPLIMTNISYILRDHQDINASIETLLKALEAGKDLEPWNRAAPVIAQIHQLLAQAEEPSNLATESRDYPLVCLILQQLITQTTANPSYIWLTKAAITTQIGSLVAPLQTKIADEEPLPNNWELKLIVQVVQWFTREITLHQTWGIQAIHSRAEKELTAIKQTLNQESSDLSNTRRAVLLELRSLYHQLAQADQKTQPTAQLVLADNIAESVVVANSLAWAGRPSYIEQQWLDDRIAKKYKPKLTFSTNHRSPMVLLTCALINYLSGEVDKKSNAIRKLHQLEVLHRQCSKLLFEKQESKKYASLLDPKRKTLELMLRMITHKEQEMAEEKEGLEITRKSILAQRLSIYFNEWKKKMFNPEELSERRKDIKQAEQTLVAKLKPNIPHSVAEEPKSEPTIAVEIDPKLRSKSHGKTHLRLFSEPTFQETCAYYSLEKIEETLHTLRTELESLQISLSPSPQLSSKSSLYKTSEGSSTGGSNPGTPKKNSLQSSVFDAETLRF